MYNNWCQMFWKITTYILLSHEHTREEMKRCSCQPSWKNNNNNYKFSSSCVCSCSTLSSSILHTAFLHSSHFLPVMLFLLFLIQQFTSYFYLYKIIIKKLKKILHHSQNESSPTKF